MSPLRTKLLAATAVLGLAGTGVAVNLSTHAYAAPTATTLTDSSIPDIAERVVESVVNIATTSQSQQGPAFSDPFFTDPRSPFYGQDPSPREQKSKGSGVIVNTSGRIITNAHVVAGATEILVTLHDGVDYPAKVIGIDPKADVAVIQLTGKNLPKMTPLAFGNSSELRLGEVVLAVGDPFGKGKSVTMGIVSAKGRSGLGIEDYEDFIQTDAAVNPGNSGGALVNLKGELIGINTAIASNTGAYAGISYAIPTNMARPIMEELVKSGKVSRGYMGVGLVTVDRDLAKQYNLGAQSGVVVAGVEPNSPAAAAGLEKFDVITSLNGAPVKADYVVRQAIGGLKPGVTVNMEVTTPRNGTKTVKVKLAEQPAAEQQQMPRRRGR